MEHAGKNQGPALPLRMLPALPLTLPDREIFKRLGGNVHRTVLDNGAARKLDRVMRQGAALCHASGCWKAVPILRNGGGSLALADGMVIASTALAECIGSAPFLWVALATVGSGIVRAAAAESDPAAAAILDAVGSECADQAMDLVQNAARRELLRQGLVLAERRFSPGYGDLPLAVQKTVFTLLAPETCGVRLTETMIMEPEKSVTAFAAVSAIPGNKPAERRD